MRIRFNTEGFKWVHFGQTGIPTCNWYDISTRRINNTAQVSKLQSPETIMLHIYYLVDKNQENNAN